MLGLILMRKRMIVYEDTRVDEGREKLETILMELRTAMFLTGSKNVSELQNKPIVITGPTREWLQTRGFDPSWYARDRRS